MKVNDGQTLKALKEKRKALEHQMNDLLQNMSFREIFSNKTNIKYSSLRTQISKVDWEIGRLMPDIGHPKDK